MVLQNEIIVLKYPIYFTLLVNHPEYRPYLVLFGHLILNVINKLKKILKLSVYKNQKEQMSKETNNVLRY